MGSGTSLLSDEDSAVLTKILKEEYDKLLSEGYKEQDIQLKLKSKYNEIIASIVAEPLSTVEAVGQPASDGNDASTKIRKRRSLHGTT